MLVAVAQLKASPEEGAGSPDAGRLRAVSAQTRAPGRGLGSWACGAQRPSEAGCGVRGRVRLPTAPGPPPLLFHLLSCPCDAKAAEDDVGPEGAQPGAHAPCSRGTGTPPPRLHDGPGGRGTLRSPCSRRGD